MSNEWLFMTASDLGRGIEAGTISPIELTELYLSAITAHPQSDEIYTTTTTKRAWAEAAKAEERAKSGTRRSPLDGVPISWKDLFDSKSIPTEAGSLLLAGRIPNDDAQVLKNATDAGLVCLGKTHMSEFAFSGLGLNPKTKTTPCVNDLVAVAGGSSSGAAGSVAFCLAAAGIGSDTGGSVRIPSAWNDLVGLKTTSGQLSLDGVVPLCPKFDTVGPLCRSVEDAHMFYAILRGEKPRSLAAKKPKRLMALTTIALDDMDDAPKLAFETTKQKLMQAGIEVEEHSFPRLNDIMALSALLYTKEAYDQWGELLEAEGDKMFEPILERFMAGKNYDDETYAQGWDLLNEVRAEWADFSADFDGVILPTCPILPPSKIRLLTEEEYYLRANLLSLRNTRIGNLLGLCAITLPTGVPSCGFMIMGKQDGETELLQYSAGIEVMLKALLVWPDPKNKLR